MLGYERQHWIYLKVSLAGKGCHIGQLKKNKNKLLFDIDGIMFCRNEWELFYIYNQLD